MLDIFCIDDLDHLSRFLFLKIPTESVKVTSRIRTGAGFKLGFC